VCHYPRLRSHRRQYIETFSIHRRRESSGEDDLVRNIDDVRNGLFLMVNVHRALGNHLAILKVRLFDLMLHMAGTDRFLCEDTELRYGHD
jgi:hypothetical protein